MRIVKILLSIILGINLLITGSGLIKAQEIPSGSYLGSYYTGKNFDNLVFTRNDSTVDFNWGRNGPDPKIGRFNFSVRWQGKFNFDSWLYEFTAISDDGVRVYFDGDTIIDQWHDAAYITYRVRRQVSSGTHNIVIEYYQNQGGDAIKFYWAKVMPTVSVSPLISQAPVPSGYQGQGAQDLYTSSCVELDTQPTEGTPPLTVQFTAAGYDPYGPISQYKFDFADASQGQERVVSQEDYTAYHTYQLPGSYNASLQIQDSKGTWRTSDNCKVVIAISGSGIGGGGNNVTPVPTASASSLPKTGVSDNLFLPLVAILVSGSFGFYLFKRFKTV